ncbi:MAG: AMP-binding protein, partial [Chloroflexota bacterium]|nr:AMP-binding protein [Chloroflexota bacterium]
MPRLLPPRTVIERRANGVWYAQSPYPLGPYPRQITERLEHWAQHEPGRPFLARRDRSGRWRRISYGQALDTVRSLAQALLDRSLSVERPLVILSGNSIEHALLALAAMYVGVLYAPIAPAYSLLAREYTTLKGIWTSMTPGLVFASDGEPFHAALAAACPASTEIVTCSPPESFRST